VEIVRGVGGGEARYCFSMSEKEGCDGEVADVVMRMVDDD
jgi:hypothetical protein